jgi:1-acyl-sn-glycerol-3-phosphate acyltransferase
MLRLLRIPLSVDGLEHLPRQQACVIVANHASYLDGMMLVATLPVAPAFVAKAELAGGFVARRFLESIGAVFVERFDKLRGVDDARGLVQSVQAGKSLAFFPEGTFTRMPGLLPFHMGAFVAAAGAGVPVVPVTIRGTRSLLRGDSRFPRRGMVRVSVSPAIAPTGSDWEAAVRLREDARAAILQHLGEPDLDRAPSLP